MAIKDADTMHYPDDQVIARLRRKANQAWDLGGLARQDGDTADMERRYAEARDWERQIKEHLRG